MEGCLVDLGEFREHLGEVTITAESEYWLYLGWLEVVEEILG